MRKTINQGKASLAGVAGFVLVWLWCVVSIAEASVLVAAASSIRPPLDRLVDAYRSEHGADIRVSYGASGNLTHQILRGAPFEIFLSADTGFPTKIHQAEPGAGKPVVYALGALVLFAHKKSVCDPAAGLAGVAEAISAGTIHHLGIANPELAPYGRAAKQAIVNAGIWETVSGKLVFGNSIAQTAQFAFSGAADCALVSRSLALGDELASVGRSSPIPDALYQPVRHSMLLLENAGDEAAAFFKFLQSSGAGEILVAGGFRLPRGN